MRQTKRLGWLRWQLRTLLALMLGFALGLTWNNHIGSYLKHLETARVNVPVVYVGGAVAAMEIPFTQTLSPSSTDCQTTVL